MSETMLCSARPDEASHVLSAWRTCSCDCTQSAGTDEDAGVSSTEGDEATPDARPSDVPGAPIAREDGVDAEEVGVGRDATPAVCDENTEGDQAAAGGDTIAGGPDAGSAGEETAAAGDVSAGDGGAGDDAGADDGVTDDEGAGGGDGADVTLVTGVTRAVDKIE